MAGDEGHNGGKDPSGEGGRDIDVGGFLAETGFVADESVLTRRQAEVLILREHGYKQSAIADQLGTSRANVSSIEASARENVEKARETLRFAERISPPVRVEIPPDTDIYTAPEMVFEACDDVGVKVGHNAPELMQIISEAAGDRVTDRRIQTHLLVNVTTDGTVWVRETDSADEGEPAR